jgi:hypothetical protein
MELPDAYLTKRTTFPREPALLPASRSRLRIDKS